MAVSRARLATKATPEDRNETIAPLDLSALTSIVGYPLRRAQLAVFDDFNRRFAAIGLTPAQYSTLAAIGANPGRKQSDIAAALGIQRPNFVAMMDELERRGLAERLQSEADRRSRALALTAAGRTLLTQARRVQGEQEKEIERLVGRAGRETLVQLLQRLAELENRP
ncbi:MAG: MarR family transcriptional regulator [Bradyrhizobium sp.]|nr:MAG: MarR family transcriptional regulator [Bradyrhizobium sp.]